MTVQTQSPTQYYSGPITIGTVLSVTDFTFVENSHISVKVRGETTNWTYGTDYTAAGAGTLTRTVTVLKAVPANKTLAVFLDVPITQGISPEEGGNLPAETLEYTLDKLTYICQDLNARLKRSLQISIDSTFDGTIYDAPGNIGKAFIVNSAGTGVSFTTYKLSDLEYIANRLYASIGNIDIVANNIASVNTTATNVANVNTVAGSIANVNRTVQSIDNVDTVGEDLALGTSSEIKKVNANKANIDSVAGSLSNITRTVQSIDNVDTVGTDLALGVNSEIKKVNANKTNIDTVAASVDNIERTVQSIDNVDTVGEDLALGTSSEIKKVNANKANIDINAANIESIQNAYSNAQTASTKASEASASAITASTQAGNAHIWSEGTDEEVQALGGVHSAKGWAEEASGGGADKSLSNLNYVGNNRLHALKGYLDEGELLTDAEGLADVRYYAHSSFDLSKFTKVGTPTITDDGIASGFSGSNIITATVPALTSPFKVSFKITTGDLTSGQSAFYSNGGDYYNALSVYGGSSKLIMLTLKLSDTSTYNLSVSSLESYTTYAGYFSWSGTEYRLHIDGLTDATYTSSLTMSTASNTTVKLGCLYTNEAPFTGSIDLKQFSITVDGKEVFNGNKSGIDQIKADNYTVVGSPTITDDGIASGADNAYLSGSVINLSTANNWEIQFKTTKGSTAGNCPFSISTGDQNGIMIDQGILYMSSGTSWDLASNVVMLPDNNFYFVKLGFTGSQYYVERSSDGVNYATVWTNDSTTKTNANTNIMLLNWTYSLTVRHFTGLFDLNAFKIYINDNLVYQPCLKIPYTQSKTGCKIVDSYYRDRVQDMYEQFGYAPYYTLNEGTNFTIPRGELYGLIENSKGYHPDIFSHQWCDHLLNNISWLRADTFSWQSGSVYTTAYNELVSEYNNASSTIVTEGSITFKRTPKGYKIADASQETAILNKYTSDGIAWYYILDTANTRFKLPRTKFGFEGLRGNVADDITESLPNINGHIGVRAGVDTGQSGAFSYSRSAATSMISTTGSAEDVRWTFNASLSSSTYQDNAPVQERATQMYLYFYVGEYAKTAIEQTAGITSEQLNNKLDINHSNDTKPYLKTTYTNGASGYNIWSNGYCEQWGVKQDNANAAFVRTFRDTDYTISFIGWGATSNGTYIIDKGTNWASFSSMNYNGSTYNRGGYWKACGYLAEGEY